VLVVGLYDIDAYEGGSKPSQFKLRARKIVMDLPPKFQTGFSPIYLRQPQVSHLVLSLLTSHLYAVSYTLPCHSPIPNAFSALPRVLPRVLCRDTASQMEYIRHTGLPHNKPSLHYPSPSRSPLRFAYWTLF
jgi:hypothetical protein